MKKITGLLICILMLQHFSATAQSFAINTDGSSANASALLDVKSIVKGILIPRMTRTERNAISAPATGLLIFQNAPDSIGFYYYNGSSWAWLLSNANSDLLAWKTGGNAGTIDGSHFIGTTDNVPLTIKVNNQKAGRIDHLLGNSFYGYQVGNNNSSGQGNAASGHTAFFTNTNGSNNTVMGRQAMYFNTTGSSNTATGYAASINNTVGSSNTANGFYALYNNVAGSNATAVGYQAMLYANNTATAFTSYNVALGYEALRGSAVPASNTGNRNTALGYQTLWSNTIGSYNTAAGESALYFNTTGINNTALGQHAMYSNTTGYHNTATGVNALLSNTIGYDNTAAGLNALGNNTTGNNNTAKGYYALGNNTTGNSNTGIGVTTLSNNTTGTANTASGFNALGSNAAGNNGTAFGYQAMANSNPTTTAFTNYSVAVGYEALLGSSVNPVLNTGNYNTALGYQTLWSNSAGSYNTAIGTMALYSNLTGVNNIAVGSNSLTTNTVGGGNTAVGINTMQLNTFGSYNTVIGGSALSHNVGGSNNCAMGVLSLSGNGAGYDNVSIGYMSTWQNSSGYRNTALGTSALGGNITGIGNTAIGWLALQANDAGSYNTSLGFLANVSAGSLTNATAIGYNAIVSSSNTMQWGNNAVTDIYGGVGSAATIHAGYASIEKDVRIDNASSNNGTYQNSLQFGSAGTGETIGSNRTAGANLWGLDFYTAFNNRMCISNGGYVGMGTTSPNAKLHISGSESTAHGMSSGIQLSNTASANSWFIRTGATGTATPAGGFSIGDNSAYRFVITSAGNVGIGTTAPTLQLELSTNSAGKPTSSTWNITSDERLKTIDGNYTKGLKDILKLNSIMYHYKNGNVRNLPTDEQGYGFLAQEVQKVFPEAVKTGSDGYLSLDIHPILVSYINGFKEQQQLIDELKKQNEILIKRIENIEKELTQKVNL
jgi:hypothetical protein